MQTNGKGRRPYGKVENHMKHTEPLRCNTVVGMTDNVGNTSHSSIHSLSKSNLVMFVHAAD